jgi:hypothetical protein
LHLLFTLGFREVDVLMYMSKPKILASPEVEALTRVWRGEAAKKLFTLDRTCRQLLVHAATIEDFGEEHKEVVQSMLSDDYATGVVASAASQIGVAQALYKKLRERETRAHLIETVLAGIASEGGKLDDTVKAHVQLVQAAS